MVPRTLRSRSCWHAPLTSSPNASIEGSSPTSRSTPSRYPRLAALIREIFPTLVALRSPDIGDLGVPGRPAEPAGARVLGDFQILREVGRGGMGVVYEAVQISLDRRVALKVLPFAVAADPRQLRRFQVEARAAAYLHHSHIIPVYAVGCERGVHYYAMQFIDGRSLAELIRACGSSTAWTHPARRPSTTSPSR